LFGGDVLRLGLRIDQLVLQIGGPLLGVGERSKLRQVPAAMRELTERGIRGLQIEQP
jgi:hypothetical protein